MDLGEAMHAALSARYGWDILKSSATTSRGLRARLNALEKAYAGNRKAAAAAAGVGYSTWTHIAAGRRHPSAATLRRLEAAYARDVQEPRAARAVARKGLPRLITVTAEVRWTDSPKKMYNARRHRTVNLDQLTRGDIAAVVDTWRRFGGPASGAALERIAARRYAANEIAFEGDQVTVKLTGEQP